MEWIEVMLWLNGVEDLKGFKIEQLVPRESLKELKGFNCTYLGHHDNQGRQIYYQNFPARRHKLSLLEDGIALKDEHNSSNATSYSEEEVMMLTQDFGNFLRRIGKISKPQGGLRMKIEIEKALIKLSLKKAQ
ncbi:hypothetical protein M9H77_33862 [Catharanthus roseus]|uniref:Uncharacterized protein n=1 Tax=Catharanthus roseus TaxID=4058 RepID=A0ACB9ZJL6_CATRO|nr:hypothetical protein M9H77_33862 [Catharanthus roseus]